MGIQIQNSLIKTYTLIFSILCMMIPFTEHLKAIPNIILGLLASLFLFVVKKNDWRILNNFSAYSFLAIIAVVILGIIGMNRNEDFSFLSKLIIAAGLVLLSIPIKDFKKPLYFFLSGASILLLISAIKLIVNYYTFGNFRMDVGSEVNNLLMGERPFLGFIYLLSFCISIFLAQIEKNKAVKIALYISILTFSAFILFISARLSLLSLIVILFISIFYTQNKIRTLIVTSGSTLVILVLTISNPNFTNRFTAGFQNLEMSIQNMIQVEPRSHIWGCSYKIGGIDSVPLLGYGFRNTVEKLTDCYSKHDKFQNESHRNYFVTSRFNTHNQFINFYLSSGLISVVLFIIFFISLIKSNYRNYIGLALVISLFFFCCFENVLSRQMGAMLFGLTYIFSFFIKNLVDNHDK